MELTDGEVPVKKFVSASLEDAVLSYGRLDIGVSFSQNKSLRRDG